MENPSIQILWDSSQLWGVMALRALRCLKIPCALVKAEKITQGDLLGKRLLLVPGGNARQKAQALGEKGRMAICQWLKNGGAYLGFCGGAGLALTHSDSELGLGLCPWRRKAYQERIYHALSGHVYAKTPNGQRLLPVWHPGRFEPEETSGLEILASYEKPGPDLWLADFPLAQTPAHILANWQEHERLNPNLAFPQQQPLVVKGEYGNGIYILSYAHLETPNSPDANSWLIKILSHYTAHLASVNTVPEWQPDIPNCEPDNEMEEYLLTALEQLNEIMRLGQQLGLFFRRTSWLWGWRSGAPGMPMNHLIAVLSALLEINSASKSLFLWPHMKNKFGELFNLFVKRAEICLWNMRLANTLSPSSDYSPLNRELLAERNEIFGHPMQGGGLWQKLMDLLEELVFVEHSGNG